MHFKYFIAAAIFTLVSFLSKAQQVSVSGRITGEDGSAVSAASVTISPLNKTVVTDDDGHYVFKDIPAGTYQIIAEAVQYLTRKNKVTVKDKDMQVNIILQQSTAVLDSVNVNATGKTFGITRLKDVDESGIYAGKKSEVVVLKDLTINTATNNARQIYGKVAGLNIYESDGGAGIQLSIGGRGLDPNRVSNFNTRQNGYDISADALGYPESYYTPPAEVLDRIEIVRGAASLEYGTQFGGIINFKMKDGNPDKKMDITERLSTGSWGFFNTSTSIGGTSGKWRYYGFFQHKSGNGWRPNSGFNANTGYLSATYNASDKFSVTFQYTHMDYLEQQPGGLPDSTFESDPRTSTKWRNWFKVHWNLGAVLLNYSVNKNLQINSRFFGLLADRSALGIIYSVLDPAQGTPGYPRNYRTDDYKNWGNETRMIYTYNTASKNPFTLLVGGRYYHGYTNRQIGEGNGGDGGAKSDFAFDKSTPYDSLSYSQYKFPNHNVALFAENIFRVNSKLSIIPGVRYENIYTKADGFYNNFAADLALNVVPNSNVYMPQHKLNNRSFLIGGIGFSYDANSSMQFYGNFSQNYKAVNFNDISIVNSTTLVDPNIKDEKGYSADLGVRGHQSNIFNYDLSLFTIYYNDRIGLLPVDTVINNVHMPGELNTNISASRNWGVESFGELDIWKLINGSASKTKLSVFSNFSALDARYIGAGSKKANVENHKVELVPSIILRSGLSFQRGKFSATYQYSYVGKQYGDASNSELSGDNGIIGPVPSYYVMDLSADFRFNKMFLLSGSINNLSNHSYFTRRADSYPGPGIIPADPRSFYLTLQVQL